ncbi:3-ketoacyl-CoA thiolase [Cordyceps fumosorosea ARSEF 2679]|uniref:acetyl-CoA C-acyltransferase n=1 Tax=Cordyceps fumosorosea (strain ARSEF 2679) TaxID=1081104 RepID=A0A168BW62_CORFA|nr:3-ketoacyl-CoA thiolase [Cordyceps fumosorosea ARSEF 2679]OAA70625.1 3-ketoacyl-CoA thiolase [Cordyceps fumosorosea ARSEF 2679]
MSLRTAAETLARSASDVVIVSALRTPVCRAYKGGLRDAYPEELLASVLAATRAAVPDLPPAAVEDVAVGVVLSELGGSKAARMALNHAGFPHTTTLHTVNRACASSLQAVASVAAEIRTGTISVGIAAGMESMTRNYGSRAVPRDDDGIREGATLEALARLKPAFAPDGASTAGNSSQVSDGAAATLLMRRGTAEALGLGGKVLGRYVAGVTVGCAPDEMGVGPALAVPKLLAATGLETRDVHRWELNEAFASQALHCVRALGLEEAWAEGRVNPDGGAIALGHPLGATGARMVATLMHGLRREAKGDVGVATLCIGTGMGHAALFVAE